ncbi:MAG: cytochrome c family protein [Flavobacteriaceae bacterium]
MSFRALIAATLIAAASPALADGDPAAGEAVFKKCRACHEVGENAKNKVGPILNGVVGRQAGTGANYSQYSNAMIEAGTNGLAWTEETLAQYLADPKGFVPKNRMAFAGLKKESDIENVIAYLKTFSQ